MDNLDIALKSRFIIDSKETTDVTGLKIGADKLIWILINEDIEHELATIIATMFESLKPSDNMIVHFNQDKTLDSAKQILILKDLDKLKIDVGNKIKSKQFESACSETEKFLLEQGIKKEEIVRIFALQREIRLHLYRIQK